MSVSIGNQVFIRPGQVVTRAGVQTRRESGTYVTVRRTEKARGGKTRVFWKSNGVLASALV